MTGKTPVSNHDHQLQAPVVVQLNLNVGVL
jgi:hypothetical protein